MGSELALKEIKKIIRTNIKLNARSRLKDNKKPRHSVSFNNKANGRLSIIGQGMRFTYPEEGNNSAENKSPINSINSIKNQKIVR